MKREYYLIVPIHYRRLWLYHIILYFNNQKPSMPAYKCSTLCFVKEFTSTKVQQVCLTPELDVLMKREYYLIVPIHYRRLWLYHIILYFNNQKPSMPAYKCSTLCFVKEFTSTKVQQVCLTPELDVLPKQKLQQEYILLNSFLHITQKEKQTIVSVAELK